MKTPREILLNKHRASAPALDSIRERVLATELGEPEAHGETGPGWLVALWQQLVLPCRTAWAGLGAAWVVIVLLWLGAAEPARLTESPAPRPAAQFRAELKQQWQLRAELLGIATARPEVPVATPGPHSEAEPVRTTLLGTEDTTPAGNKT